MLSMLLEVFYAVNPMSQVISMMKLFWFKKRLVNYCLMKIEPRDIAFPAIFLYLVLVTQFILLNTMEPTTPSINY